MIEQHFLPTLPQIRVLIPYSIFAHSMINIQRMADVLDAAYRADILPGGRHSAKPSSLRPGQHRDALPADHKHFQMMSNEQLLQLPLNPSLGDMMLDDLHHSAEPGSVIRMRNMPDLLSRAAQQVRLPPTFRPVELSPPPRPPISPYATKYGPCDNQYSAPPYQRSGPRACSRFCSPRQ